MFEHNRVGGVTLPSNIPNQKQAIIVNRPIVNAIRKIAREAIYGASIFTAGCLEAYATTKRYLMSCVNSDPVCFDMLNCKGEFWEHVTEDDMLQIKCDPCERLLNGFQNTTRRSKYVDCRIETNPDYQQTILFMGTVAITGWVVYRLLTGLEKRFHNQMTQQTAEVAS